MPSLNHAQLLDGTKESSANVPDERLLQSFKLKTVSYIVIHIAEVIFYQNPA